MGKRNKREAESKKKTAWTPTDDQIRLLVVGLMNIPIDGVSLLTLSSAEAKLKEINKLKEILVGMLPKGK